jgi:DNA-binding transcriptional LysR family regulator
MFDWNDLRYFLATARAGSTVGASQIMRVNQSTVGRRIAALERSLGAKLFDRTAAGYRLTEVGQDLLPSAERAEAEAAAVLLLVEQRARLVAGTIKVTTNETIADLFLMPALTEFADLYPDIRVDVIVSSRWLDLERGEADVALRAARHLYTGTGSARRLAELPWAIYCSRRYAETHGRPTTAEQLRQHKIIGVDGPLAAVAGFDFLEQNAGDEAVVARTNSLPNLLAAVRAGLGISALPCVRGEADPQLLRCLGPNQELSSSLWLITRGDTRHEPKTRAFSSFAAAKTPVLRDLLRFDDDMQH